MKKLIFILLPLFLLANENTHYNKALKLFKEKKYQEAFEIFETLSENDLGNQNINFYMGRILFEMGEYDMAISYFERILFSQPTNSRAQLEIAQSYLMQKNYILATKEFETILSKKDLPEKVRENIKKRIEFITRNIQKHFFTGVLIFNAMYDSNTNNGTEGTIYYYNLPTTGSKPESDFTAQVISVLNHSYKYNDKVTIDNSLTLFAQDYNTVSDKNIEVLSLSVKPSITDGKNKYTFGFGIDKVRYNDASLYGAYNLFLGQTRIISKTTLNDINLKLTKKSYDKIADKNKNSYVFELKNDFKYKTENIGLFNFGINLSKELEINSSSTEINKNSYELSLSNSYPLPNKFSMTSLISTKKSMYNDYNSGFSNIRNDETTTLSLDLKRPLAKNLILGFTLSKLKNNSNQGAYDYDKHIIKTSLIYTF